jgi:predicted nuclease of predicted toxin-antitoxin system
LVPRLAAKGVTAQHIARVGRAGMSDGDLWSYAFDTDQVVATLNARDFLLLARSVELHPGLIVLRTSGLSPDGQWHHLEPTIDFALAELAVRRLGQPRDRGVRPGPLPHLRPARTSGVGDRV